MLAIYNITVIAQFKVSVLNIYLYYQNLTTSIYLRNCTVDKLDRHFVRAANSEAKRELRNIS